MKFRPEAIARREQPWDSHVRLTRTPSGRVVAALGAALVVATASFLFFGTYTRRVHAVGDILPYGGLLRVEAPGGGVVSYSAAVEGRKVSTGELLYVIDDDPNSMDGKTETEILGHLERQIAILHAQRTATARTAETRKAALVEQLELQSRQRREVDDELAAQAPLLDASRTSWMRMTEAFGQHLATSSSMENENIGYAQLLTTHAQFLQTAFGIGDKVVQLRSDLRTFDDDNEARLSAIDKEESILRQQVAETRARHAIRVLAPRDGIAAAVLVGVGQAVRSGTRLADVIPAGSPMRAELYVDSAAVGVLRVGDDVRLRYDAFPYQRFGLYDGTVTEVSRAPMTEETEEVSDRPLRKNVGLYRVVVTPRTASVRVDGQDVPLQAGMTVDADIGVERRTLFRWLLGPVNGFRTSAALVAGNGAGA